MWGDFVSAGLGGGSEGGVFWECCRTAIEATVGGLWENVSLDCVFLVKDLYINLCCCSCCYPSSLFLYFSSFSCCSSST